MSKRSLPDLKVIALYVLVVAAMGFWFAVGWHTADVIHGWFR